MLSAAARAGARRWVGAALAVVVAAVVFVAGAPVGAGATTYRLKPGDTLGAVAARLGVPLSRLAAANRISDPSRVMAGRVLVVPPAAAPATQARRPAPTAARWRCPVLGAPRFVNDFGYVKPETGLRHEGVDLFAPRGTPVVAPVGGVVRRFPNPLGGLAVQLQGTDGTRYYGAHLDRYGAVGRVAAGTVIGYVGNTGNARTTSPHLHFEAHPGGKQAVNPFPALVAACR